MKKILLTLIFLLFFNLNLFAETVNPYKDYNLQDTQKIMISFFKTKEHKTIEGRRTEVEPVDISKILTELNTLINFKPGEVCDCVGDGKIFFLLKSGKEVEFRVKHGGEIIEYNYGKSDNQFLRMPKGFVQVIKKYYPKDLLGKDK